MRQQINLLELLPKPVKTVLGFEMLVYICGAFMVLMLLMSVYDVWQNARIAHKLILVQHKVEEANAHLTQVKARYPEVTDIIALEKTLPDLEKEVEIKNIALETIYKKNQFSNYLMGLARSSVLGVWLKTINIASGGQKIRLIGTALEPKLIEKFLENLNQEFNPLGKSFVIFELNRPQIAKNSLNMQRVDFSLVASNAVGKAL